MKKIFFLIVSIMLFYFLYAHFVKRTNVDSFVNNDAIIDQALNFELSPTDVGISAQASEFSDRSFKKVKEGKYLEAVKIAMDGLKVLPKNFLLQSDFAALLGDYSEIAPTSVKDKILKKSKDTFNKLNRNAENQPKDVFFDFKNEYYYRHAKYLEQYELGIARANYFWNSDKWATEGIRGYYSLGVGASNYAKVLIKEGKKQLAHDYAQKAVIAWAQYFSYRNDYYNAYVHHAMALGILGLKEEMMRALIRSASLVKKDLSYFEFKEVLDFVNSINF